MIIFPISFIIWFTVKSLSHNSLRMQILHIVALPKLTNSKLTISNCHLPKDNKGCDHFFQKYFSKHIFSYNSKVFYFLKYKFFQRCQNKSIAIGLKTNLTYHCKYLYFRHSSFQNCQNVRGKIYLYMVKLVVPAANNCP